MPSPKGNLHNYMTKEQENNLILKAQQGDLTAENTVALNYLGLTKSIARSFGAIGIADTDDLAGYGMLGLVRAIRTYDTTSDASFKTYASKCIKNAIVDATRKVSSKMEEVNLDDVFQDTDSDPENVFLENEASSLLLDAISATLNPTEFAVLRLYIECMSYADISKELGLEQKKVDNTIYSAKRKIKKLLETSKKNK